MTSTYSPNTREVEISGFLALTGHQNYLVYSRCSSILKRGRERAHKTVMPMPSFLTLIFPSPESFQRQRRPKQRMHLPLRSKPRRRRLVLLGPQDLPMCWALQPMEFYGFSSDERQSIPISYTQQQYCSLSLLLPTCTAGSLAPYSCCVQAAPSLAQPPASGILPRGREVNTRALIYSCA